MSTGETNDHIARTLEQIADLLDTQHANPFRIRAYRDAAETIRTSQYPVGEWVKDNQLDKLDALPHIGRGIIAVVAELVSTGKSSLLDELESENEPERVFATVPGIGKELAVRIVSQLNIKTLPQLEEVAHSGQLGSIEGFGAKRLANVRAALAGMLSRRVHQDQQKQIELVNAPKQQYSTDRPSVKLLLKVDSDYRKGVKEGTLQKIAPRRFNPNNEAWLPILHTKRENWNFTALFSNTAQAHKLGKTDDWVVIYFEKGNAEHQHTVVTETKGALKGKRVVRGREGENQAYYNHSNQT